MRPSVSEVPPAANGAMNLTGLVGQVWAWLGCGATARPSATRASSSIGLLIISFCDSDVVSHPSQAQGGLLLPARGEKVGMRGPLHDSERLRLVERPPHPRRALVVLLTVLPSPRKRGEVRRVLDECRHR